MGGLGASDMNAAEIGAEQLAGLPLLEEHSHSSKKGTCLASWQGPDGSLRVEAVVDDPVLQNKIRSGESRGFSLGTHCVLAECPDGVMRVRNRLQNELSVVKEGARPGTWIDRVDGRRVHIHQRASSAPPLLSCYPHPTPPTKRAHLRPHAVRKHASR